MNHICIDTERCKGCCLCIEACPRNLIEVCDRPNANGYYPARYIPDSECIACALCATVCPDVAIEVYREDEVARKPRDEVAQKPRDEVAQKPRKGVKAGE